MERIAFRPLVPASRLPSQPTRDESESRLSIRRLRKTRVACNPCRAKKSACDAGRPVCKQCQTRGSSCVYTSMDESETPAMVLKRENETLRKSLTSLEELINHLKYMPDDIAQTILTRLRTTADPASVVQSIRGDILGGCVCQPDVNFQLPHISSPPVTLPMASPTTLGSSEPLPSSYLPPMDYPSGLESPESVLSGQNEPLTPESYVAPANRFRSVAQQQVNVSAGTAFPQPYPGKDTHYIDSRPNLSNHSLSQRPGG